MLDGTLIPPTSTDYGGMALVSTKFPYPSPAKLLTAQDAVTQALNFAGASLVRDGVDKRLIAELRSYGTVGELMTNENDPPMGGPGTIASGTKAKDTDGDGIPDAVEVAMGTNPNVADSMQDKNGNGYANVEDWANSLVP